MADATDSSVVDLILERHKPDVLVLVAGAQPTTLPLQDQTWETFSRNWEVDVRMTFHWIRKALTLPLASGSQILVMSGAPLVTPRDDREGCWVLADAYFAYSSSAISRSSSAVITAAIAGWLLRMCSRPSCTTVSSSSPRMM